MSAMDTKKSGSADVDKLGDADYAGNIGCAGREAQRPFFVMGLWANQNARRWKPRRQRDRQPFDEPRGIGFDRKRHANAPEVDIDKTGFDASIIMPCGAFDDDKLSATLKDVYSSNGASIPRTEGYDAAVRTMCCGL